MTTVIREIQPRIVVKKTEKRYRINFYRGSSDGLGSSVQVLDDLNDVAISNLANDHVLTYDDNQNLWVNKSVALPQYYVNYPTVDPDYPPESPSVFDDNFFMDQSFNASKWQGPIDHWGNSFTGSFIQNVGMSFRNTNNVDYFKGYYQPISAQLGNNFDVMCKLTLHQSSTYSAYSDGGVFISDGISTTANKAIFLDVGGSQINLKCGKFSQNPSVNFDYGYYSTFNTSSTQKTETFYLRLNWETTNAKVRAMYSLNGLSWIEFKSLSNSGITTPTHVGICLTGNNLDDDHTIFHWYRVKNHGSGAFSRYLNPGRILTNQ